MSSRRTGVFPCRQDKKRGWWECLPHRATHWAAIVKGRVIGRYSEKRKADLMLDIELKRSRGPARRYVLGGRMGAPEWRA